MLYSVTAVEHHLSTGRLYSPPLRRIFRLVVARQAAAPQLVLVPTANRQMSNA